MADFNTAFNITVSKEGGYVSAADAASSSDPGGETYIGVARNYNPNWAGWAIIDAYKNQNGIPARGFIFPDSYGLTPLVGQLFKSQYWDAIQGDQIASQDIANLIFDMNIMSGGAGIKQVQQAVNQVYQPPIAVDGGFGNDTLSAVNSAPQDQLYSAIYNTRQSFFSSAASLGNPNATGWLARLASFPSQIAATTAQAAQAAQETIEETVGETEQVVQQNPGLAMIAALFLIGGAGILTWWVFFHKTAATIVTTT